MRDRWTTERIVQEQRRGARQMAGWLVLVLLAWAFFLCAAYLATAHAQTLPDPTLTPGVIRPLTTAQICGTKWGLDRRFVTEAMKRQIATAYHRRRASVVGPGKGPVGEFDHLIPRELGGADDVKNMWIQRWVEAKKKDALENLLHQETCAGRITLSEAQTALRTNWWAAYQKYLGAK